METETFTKFEDYPKRRTSTGDPLLYLESKHVQTKVPRWYCFLAGFAIGMGGALIARGAGWLS